MKPRFLRVDLPDFSFSFIAFLSTAPKLLLVQIFSSRIRKIKAEMFSWRFPLSAHLVLRNFRLFSNTGQSMNFLLFWPKLTRCFLHFLNSTISQLSCFLYTPGSPFAQTYKAQMISVAIFIFELVQLKIFITGQSVVSAFSLRSKENSDTLSC